MEQRRQTKRIVDWIVAKATWGHFKGDKRDGEAPPITIKNFAFEGQRYGAKALRARLSRLSLAELSTEANAGRAYGPSELAQIAERYEREKAARDFRQRQSERGRKSRLQPAILAAARHYRDQEMNAGEAWDALSKTPFETDDGCTVEINGSKLPRLEQRMRVILPDGRQRSRPIRFDQWRKRYWSAGA